MRFSYIDSVQLMVYGVHIGHSLKNTLSTAYFYVFAFRLSLALIDLFKTILALRVSVFCFSSTIYYCAPVWFVNLNQAGAQYTRHAALNCGEFYVVNRWINGSISNYYYVYRSWRKFVGPILTVYLSKHRIEKTHPLYAWYLTRYSWPRLAFFSNVLSSLQAVRECFSAKIPSVGIVDTNTPINYISLPIPGNDEAIPALIFYNDLFSNFILMRKFSNIILWFLNVRSSKRVIDFATWVYSRKSFLGGKTENGLFNSLTYFFNIYKNYSYSMYLVSNFSYNFYLFYEKLDLLHEETNNDRIISHIYFSLLNNYKHIITLINFDFFFKRLISNPSYNNNFLNEIDFKVNHLKKSVFLKKLKGGYNFNALKFLIKKSFFINAYKLLNLKSNISSAFVVNNYNKWRQLLSRYFISYNSNHFLMKSSFYKIIKLMNISFTSIKNNLDSIPYIQSKTKNFNLFNFYYFIFLRLSDLYFFYYFYKYIVDSRFYCKLPVLDVVFLSIFLGEKKFHFLPGHEVFPESLRMGNVKEIVVNTSPFWFLSDQSTLNNIINKEQHFIENKKQFLTFVPNNHKFVFFLSNLNVNKLININLNGDVRLKDFLIRKSRTFIYNYYVTSGVNTDVELFFCFIVFYFSSLNIYKY